MQPPEPDWARWLETLGLSALAGFAGLLGFVTRKLDANERPSVMRAVIEAFSAALVGFIVIQICSYYNVDSRVVGALCGVTGWMGAPASIKLFEKILKRKLGVTDEPRSDVGQSDKQN